MLSRVLYDRTDRVDSGFVYWTFETSRYFGSAVPEGIPVKILPREKNALDPGFELNYNTPSTGGASMVNGESTSKIAPHTPSNLGYQVKYNALSAASASMVNGKSASKDTPHIPSNGSNDAPHIPSNGSKDAPHIASNGAHLQEV